MLEARQAVHRASNQAAILTICLCKVGWETLLFIISSQHGIGKEVSLPRFTPSNCSVSVKLSFVYVFESGRTMFNPLDSRYAATCFTFRIEYES